MPWDLMLWLTLLLAKSVFYGRFGFYVDGLIVAAVIHAGLHSQITFQVHWFFMPLYVLCALGLFMVSLWLTKTAVRQYLGDVARCHWRGQREIAVRALTTAVYEELIWRILLQSFLANLIGTFIAVVVVAAAFTFWHRRQIWKNTAQGGELLLFSLILGGVFASVRDPLLPVLIHALRNYFVESHQRYAQSTCSS